MAKHANVPQRRWLPAAVAVALALAVVTTEGLRQHAGAHTSTADDQAYVAQIAASEAAQSSARASASAEASDASVAASQSSASAAAAAHAATSAAQVTAITSLAAGKSASAISIAALNVSTGASYQWGATGGMDTGSIVKLYILETLLLRDQNSGGMSSSEQATATKMIENSDNDAAETLFEDIGGRDALIAANATLGLANTTPGPGDYWGLTQTGAPDYVTLLKNLVETSGSPLNATSQAYVLGLMRDVESDQRWGVGVTADPGTDFANKNGWLGVDDDNGLWLVNSTGVVTIKGQQVLMVVLTQHDSDFASGVTLVQSLAQAVAPLVAS